VHQQDAYLTNVWEQLQLCATLGPLYRLYASI